MTHGLFKDREEAGWQLAERLKGTPLTRPLVLVIPRGGIEVGVPLARVLGAELDVVLSRKLRAPGQPELALGAISESGETYLNHHTVAMTEAAERYLEEESARQLAEIDRRKQLSRSVRTKAEVTGRSVILTDDGIATGSTMISALRTIRAQRPHEIIVAVPVAPRNRVDEIGPLSDRVVCLRSPEEFWAVGQFYRDFAQVSDERVLELLTECERAARARPAGEHGTPATRSTSSG